MVNWIGGDGTLWTTGSNWAGGQAPDSFQSAVITETGPKPVLVVIAAGQNVSANPLTLGASGHTETVTLIDDGSFSNYAGVTLYAGTTIDDAGAMTWYNGGYDAGLIEVGGSFAADGSVTVAAGGSLDIAAGGSAYVATVLTVDGTVSVEGSLSDATGVAGKGTVLVDGGTLDGGNTALNIHGSTLAFVVSNGGSLAVSPPGAGTSITLDGNGNTLDIAQYSGTIAASITGLGPGDSITVGNSDNGTATNNGNGTYTVTMGGVTLSDVTLDAGLDGKSYSIGNGTLAACYLRGTRLRTPRGDVAVEALGEGDTLLTASGRAAPIAWIGRRRYDAALAAISPMLHPIRFRAGSLGPGAPRRDLRVSPLHAMFLDGVLVPAMLLVNGVSVVQEEPEGEIEYFHVELDRHDIVLAEGAAAESFRDENSRDMFDNAREWHGRGAAGPACAARVEHGFALEALRRRIEARAGIAPSGGPAPGALEGAIEICEVAGGAMRIEGWARDRLHPEAPVCLAVLAGGRVVGQVLANRARGAASRDGFAARLAMPPGLAGGSGTPPGAIELRREADGARLAHGLARAA